MFPVACLFAILGQTMVLDGGFGLPRMLAEAEAAPLDREGETAPSHLPNASPPAAPTFPLSPGPGAPTDRSGAPTFHPLLNGLDLTSLGPVRPEPPGVHDFEAPHDSFAGFFDAHGSSSAWRDFVWRDYLTQPDVLLPLGLGVGAAVISHW